MKSYNSKIINNQYWINAEVLKDSHYVGLDWYSGTWYDGIWKCGQWHDGHWNIPPIWISGDWIGGAIFSEMKYYWVLSEVSPKCYYKPKTTMSLNYAKYKD